MSLFLLATVSAAGGLGAVCRFLLDGLLRARWPHGTLPWPTTVINVSGSFLLGIVIGVGLAPAGALLGTHGPGSTPTVWAQIAGTGFLGGYTTFSAASVEAVQMIRQRRWAAAGASAAGVLVAGTAAATAGLLIGARLL